MFASTELLVVAACLDCDYSAVAMGGGPAWADKRARAFAKEQMKRHWFECPARHRPLPRRWRWVT